MTNGDFSLLHPHRTGSVGMYPQFLRERPDVPAIDVARFILEEVKPHADDFVVVKMDVEGSEYPLIEHLRANEVLPLIDEIFIETHFNHKSMAAFGWGTFIAKRPDAHAMLRQVRSARGGIFLVNYVACGNFQSCFESIFGLFFVRMCV
jgi:hypothetical protein